MANPFKPDDKVLTFRKGIEIEATVRTIWNHEVQVRTAEGDLLWRTMKTVRSVVAPETGQPTDTPQNPEPPTAITQAEPARGARGVEGPPIRVELDPPTVDPPTVEPHTVEPTTVEPTTVEPTTVEPTTVEPTTVEPPTVEPPTVEPPTVGPTTVEPTAVEPAPCETASQPVDPPAERVSRQPAKGTAKPKKRRRGILSKFMGSDSDQ